MIRPALPVTREVGGRQGGGCNLCAGSCCSALCESWNHPLASSMPPPQPRHSTDTRISPLSDCSTLILSMILRNLGSSAPNYTGSLNWPKGGIRTTPWPLSILLGSLPHLRLASQTVCHPVTSLNHLSPLPNETSPAFSTSEKYLFKAGRRANHKTTSTNPKGNSDSVANEGGGDVYANQRVTSSWLRPFHSKTAPTVLFPATA